MLGTRGAAGQGSQAPPSGLKREAAGQYWEITQSGSESVSDWDTLPTGTVFESISQGTVDELTLVSQLIVITRTTMEAGSIGFTSFFNGNPGMIGPRILCVDQGVMELGPVDVSPGSRPGPALLVRSADQGKKTDSPAVVLPQTTIEVRSGELIFFPADTSFYASNYEGKERASYLEIDVFPTYTPSPDDEGVERFAVDLGIETADPPAPPVVGVGRLALEPQAGLSAPKSSAGAQLFYVEQGSLTATGLDGKVQLSRGDVAHPGEIVEAETELILNPGDAFLIPPGGQVALQSADVPATLLVLEVRALN